MQFKFLHRSNYTPSRLARMYPNSSAEWWCCVFPPDNAEHNFLKCQRIQDFWVKVTTCITEVTTVPIPMLVRVCLLGLVEDVVPSRALRTLLSILLFYTRKAIFLHWKKPKAPTLPFWKGLVNSMLPSYRATYVSRGCMKKIYKVWEVIYPHPLIRDDVVGSFLSRSESD